ncbi:MAG: hypothetical protein ACFCUR_16545 [Rhodomicrobiaceae bacterium]
MKSVIIGILVMIALSAVAWGIMGTQEVPVADAYTSKNSVRLN